MDDQLVYVGKIIALDLIENADFICSATVVCGDGGKWRGLVKKGMFFVGSKCVVYLPDALIPQSEEMSFMESRGWRVRMTRFRGAPSEVLIMPFPCDCTLPVGTDVTQMYGAKKYHKPIPANLQGVAKGEFPSFIPKTDELNYQRHFDLVDTLHGKPYYITEKADGASSTAYHYRGQFGVCSRNLDLVEDDNNAYWKLAKKYKLHEVLPEGYALQWETCGPKIQNNPMGLREIDGFAFSAYNIEQKMYLEFEEFNRFCFDIAFPMVKLICCGESFDKDSIHQLGEGVYDNGKQREGVVVRSKINFSHRPISFKVINLNYEK